MPETLGSFRDLHKIPNCLYQGYSKRITEKTVVIHHETGKALPPDGPRKQQVKSVTKYSVYTVMGGARGRFKVSRGLRGL